MKVQDQNEKLNIYIPMWYIESFLYFLRGHLIEGDLTVKQMITAIDNCIVDLNNAEIEDV